MTPFFHPHRHFLILCHPDRALPLSSRALAEGSTPLPWFFESRFVFWGLAAPAAAPAAAEAPAPAAEGPAAAPAPGLKPARVFDDKRDAALGHLKQIDTFFPKEHAQRPQAEALRGKLDQEICAQFDALHADYDRAFAALTSAPPEEAAAKGIKDQYQPKADALITAIKERLDTEAEVKAEVEAHASPEKQDEEKTKYINNANLPILGRRLARTLELTPDQTTALLENPDVLKAMLATLPLELLQKPDKDFKLTDRQKAGIRAAMPKTPELPEKAELDLIATMARTGGPLEGLPADSLKGGLSYTLAKAHRFEQTPDGKYLVDDQELTTGNRGDLIRELDSFFKEKTRKLEGEETEQGRMDKCRATLAPLDKQGSAEEKADKAMADLQDAFRNSKDIKKMGTKELISFALQLWAVAKAALTENPPDFETLGEMVKDITDQPMRNPAEVMAKNRANYGKILENQKPSLATLIGCYAEPRGEESKALFSKENAEAAGITDPKELKDIGKYMNEVRPLIRANLTKGLDIKITAIEFHAETGITEITAYKGNKRMALEIDKPDGEGRLQVTLVPYESKATTEDPNAMVKVEAKIQSTSVGRIEELKDFVGGEKPAAAKTTSEADVARAKVEEKKEVPKTAEQLGWNPKAPPGVDNANAAILAMPNGKTLLEQYKADAAKDKPNPKAVAQWRLKWLVDHEVPKAVK